MLIRKNVADRLLHRNCESQIRVLVVSCGSHWDARLLQSLHRNPVKVLFYRRKPSEMSAMDRDEMMVNENYQEVTMDFYKVVTANDRRTFEKQLNEAHKEGYKINKDGIQVNTNGVGLNLIYTAVLCRS